MQVHLVKSCINLIFFYIQTTSTGADFWFSDGSVYWNEKQVNWRVCDKPIFLWEMNDFKKQTRILVVSSWTGDTLYVLHLLYHILVLLLQFYKVFLQVLQLELLLTKYLLICKHTQNFWDRLLLLSHIPKEFDHLDRLLRISVDAFLMHKVGDFYTLNKTNKI